MNALTKLGTFALIVGVAFAGAYGAGHAAASLAADTGQDDAHTAPPGTGHAGGHGSGRKVHTAAFTVTATGTTNGLGAGGEDHTGGAPDTRRHHEEG